jgi:hypothetical protein
MDGTVEGVGFSESLMGQMVRLVAGSAFAAIEFLDAVGEHVCVVTRLRLDVQSVRVPAAKAQRPRPATDQGQAP